MLYPFRRLLFFRAPERGEIREFGKGEEEITTENPGYIKRKRS